MEKAGDIRPAVDDLDDDGHVLDQRPAAGFEQVAVDIEAVGAAEQRGPGHRFATGPLDERIGCVAPTGLVGVSQMDPQQNLFPFELHGLLSARGK